MDNNKLTDLADELSDFHTRLAEKNDLTAPEALLVIIHLFIRMVCAYSKDKESGLMVVENLKYAVSLMWDEPSAIEIRKMVLEAQVANRVGEK